MVRVKFIAKSGSAQSDKPDLPAPVVVGPREINVSGKRHGIKLPYLPLAEVPRNLSPGVPLLYSAQLVAISPTSFLCSSFLLLIVQYAGFKPCLDSPSDHWEKLMDAWMCYPDQKLTDEFIKHAKNGFNPAASQTLVGGSYLLLGQGKRAQLYPMGYDPAVIATISSDENLG